MSDEATEHEIDSAAHIKQAVRGGTRAVLLAQILSQVVSLVTLGVLLRAIGDPAPFGLVAMVVPWLLLLRIFTTLGLNVATVERAEMPPGEVSSLFWLNVLFGLATTAVTIALARPLAWFYGEPRLVNVTTALAATAALAALAMQHQALLERKLKFGRLALGRLVAQLLGGIVAMAAALAGWGVWALVVQQYIELASLAAVLWACEPWRPAHPWRGAAIGPHLRLGGYYAAGSVVNFWNGQFDKLLLGYFAGAHELGLYSQAFNVMIRPVYLITTPLAGIVLASLSRAAGHGRARAELLTAYYRLLGIALLPAGVGLFLLGSEVMRLLGGPNWSSAGPILSALGLAMFGQGLINIGGSIFASAGRTDLWCGATLATALLLAPVLAAGWALGAHHAVPALGVAWGYTIVITFAVLVPYTLLIARVFGERGAELLGALGRPAVAALAMGAAVWLLQQAWNAYATPDAAPAWLVVRLATEMALGASVYLGLARRSVAALLRF